MTEFKLRYFDSVLGYMWTILRPLMLFGVLYIVFTEIVNVGDKVPHYAVILLAALVIFYFFGEATNNGLTSLVARESLIRKVVLPAAGDSRRRGADLGGEPRLRCRDRVPVRDHRRRSRRA